MLANFECKKISKALKFLIAMNTVFGLGFATASNLAA